MKESIFRSGDACSCCKSMELLTVIFAYLKFYSKLDKVLNVEG